MKELTFFVLFKEGKEWHFYDHDEPTGYKSFEAACQAIDAIIKMNPKEKRSNYSVFKLTPVYTQKNFIRNITLKTYYKGEIK